MTGYPPAATAPRAASLQGFDWLMGVPALLLTAFMAGPLIQLLATTPPANLWTEATNGENWTVIINSVILGAISAAVATACGVPLAYLLARRDFFGKRIVESVVQLPVALPHVVIGIALLATFGPRAILGAFMEDWFGVRALDTRLGVVLGMTYVSIPYVVNSTRAGFESVGDRLEKTARTLGASPSAVFFEISLPLARNHILNGVSLTWGRAISELGAIMILAYHPMTVAVYVWDVYKAYGEERLRSVGALALLVYLTVFIGFRVLTLRKQERR